MITFYAYAFKPGGVVLTGKEFGRGDRAVMRAGRDGLKNSLVFSWGFVELVTWFWVSYDFSFLFQGERGFSLGIVELVSVCSRAD